MAKYQNRTKWIPLLASELSKYKCQKGYLEYLCHKIFGIEWVFVITSNLTIHKVTIMINCRATHFERRCVHFPCSRGLLRRDKNERKERDLRSLSPFFLIFASSWETSATGESTDRSILFFQEFQARTMSNTAQPCHFNSYCTNPLSSRNWCYFSAGISW